jgi:GNAT superfamily N-acetyltransferase
MITDSRVVELTSDDWADLRTIRLRALADAPDSFSLVLEEVVDLPDDAWRARLVPEHPTYVVREAGTTVAMAGGFAPPDSPVAWVWGMWTAPAARGRGHSTSLLDAVVRWARRLGRTPHLHVTEGNETARRLYTRYGFEPTGVWEPLREGSHLRIEELALTRG